MKKDTLYIIDLDRTLIDVGKVMEITEKACKEVGVDFKKILSDHEELAKQGIAYSPFEYISNSPGADIEKFKNTFIELSSKDRLLFSDSRSFLDKLKGESIDYVILTYGADKLWQILKIKAANFDQIPYVIVNDRLKGRFIKSWVGTDGNITPKIDKLRKYKSCVFVDDRLAAFIDLPSNCRGYLLDRSGEKKFDSDLPGGLSIIKNLHEVKI